MLGGEGTCSGCRVGLELRVANVRNMGLGSVGDSRVYTWPCLNKTPKLNPSSLMSATERSHHQAEIPFQFHYGVQSPPVQVPWPEPFYTRVPWYLNDLHQKPREQMSRARSACTYGQPNNLQTYETEGSYFDDGIGQ